MYDFTLVVGNKNYSSWSFRAFLAVECLKLSNQSLRVKEVLLPLDTEEFYQEIKHYNPAGTVPVLIDHRGQKDIHVCDSLAIIDYLADQFPEYGFWPKTAGQNANDFATAKSICAEMHSGLFAIRAHLPMNMRAKFEGYTFGPKVVQNIQRITDIWTDCLNKNPKGPYLFGDVFSAPDMMFAPVVSRFKTYAVQTSGQINAYRDAVENHPAFKSWYLAALEETAIVDQDEVDREVKVLGAE